MTSQTVPLSQAVEEEHFQSEQVFPIAGAHFINDIYTSFVPPLLPVIIEKLSLSLTMAGSLTAIMQVPAIINPFIGYLADKVSLRYFIIFAPAVTATAISLIGFAPDYFWLALLLFVAGASTAAFHAPAPAMIGRVSGKRVGLGMSLFMAFGELSFTIGPLLAVWAVTTWTLDGFWRVVIPGWAATILLYWRLRKAETRVEKPGSLRAILPFLGSVFIPLALANLFRYPLLECLFTYLPIYMKQGGASLWAAGLSFSLVELAGVVGVLSSGPLSDRLGRKRILVLASVLSTILMMVFLKVSGWLLVPVLLAMGFAAYSTTPIIMAMVQEYFPNNRAVANGLYMMIAFLMRPIGTLVIGILGDNYGLPTAYFWGAMISLCAVPAYLALPEKRT